MLLRNVKEGRIAGGDLIFSRGQLGTHLDLSVRLWRIRVTSASRAVRSIARQEPVWLVGVIFLASWALVAAAPKVSLGGRPWIPPTAIILLAALLESSRTDARTVALMGGSFGIVRLVDAILWLSPLLFWVTVQMPAGTLAAVLGIVVVSLGPTSRLSRSNRFYRPYTRLIALGAIEWIAGLRRAPWLFVGSTLVGVLGPPHPLLVVAAMLTVTVVVTAYHWTPAEGWLILHVADRTPRSFLWHKVAVSSALLACALIAIIASALIRGQLLPAVFSFAVLLCIHAHICGVLSRYVAYQPGLPLSTSGSLTWLLSAALIVLPPAALIALFMLERRALHSLTPYCRSTATRQK